MLRLTTLGAIDLRDRLGRPVREVLSQPKRIALLIHLVLEGRRGPVARDRLCAMFWPESDETRARNALSQAVYHLRQSIGPDLLVGQGPTLELAADRVWCDALVLEEAIAREEVELALDIHKGEFCPGLLVSGAAAFEEWVSETQRDQRRRLLALARRGVQRAAVAGDTEGAARVARRALTLFPDDERDVREYLTLIDAAGDGTGALALYAEYARRLAAELETDPSPETRTLVERIRQRRTAATASRAGVETRTETPPTDAVTPSSTPAAPAAASAHTTSTARTADSAAHSARTVRRSFLVAAALLLLLIWGVSGRARLGVAADRISRPSGPSAVAVFPFTVRGGEPENELSDGLAVLLAAKLDGTDEVRAIDPRSATNAAEGRSPDPARGDALSRGLGARYYVLGDLMERAGRLQLEGALYATGRPDRAIATASVAGDTAALFELVDDLAGRLLAAIVPGRDPSLTKLAAITTSSLPALKVYLRGERALRAGQDARAAAAFREAALLDTNFALAQYRLALVANWIAVPGAENPLVWADAAARNDRRLTALGRDLVEAFRAYKLPSSTAAERYRAIIDAYPDNVEAWYMYGESLFHYGPYRGSPASDARAAFERVLVLDPANSHALVHLARIAAIEGRTDELAAIEARHRERHADADRSLEIRALLAWARQDSAAVAAVIAEAQQSDPIVMYGLHQAAIYSMDLPAARQLATRLAEVGSVEITRPFAQRAISEVSLGSGQLRHDPRGPASTAARAQWELEAEVLAAVEPVEAATPVRLKELRARLLATRPFLALGVPAREIPPDAAPQVARAMRTYLLGSLDMRLGDSASARAQLDSLDRWSERPGAEVARETARRFAISLRAGILREQGRTVEALSEIERYPLEILPHRLGHDGIRERFLRAELLVALGRDQEALRWLRTFPVSYDLVFLAPASFREAQLLERLGRAAEARAAYERVLRLWRDADPELQHLVRAASASLTRLQ